MPPPNLLNLTQLCDRLKIDPKTARHMIEDGLLPSVTIGRRRFFRPEDADALLAGKQPTR